MSLHRDASRRKSQSDPDKPTRQQVSNNRQETMVREGCDESYATSPVRRGSPTGPTGRHPALTRSQNRSISRPRGHAVVRHWYDLPPEAWQIASG